MLPVLLIAMAPVEALTPPVGWTALGPDRAVLVLTDPSRGELREIRLVGTNLEPQALAMALTTPARHTRVLKRDGDGTVNLQVGSDLVGRARMSPGSGAVTWYVVLASQEASEQLDADALLTALVPALRPANLQSAQVEVLPAGRDGSLWDPVVGSEPPAAEVFDPWGAPVVADDDQWSQSHELVGIWGGAMDGPWGSKELVLSLDVNGRVRVEERDGDASQVTEGTRGTRAGQLRIASFTGDPVVSDYEATSKALTFGWRGEPVTLFKRR